MNPDIEATIRLFNSDEGGRSQATRSDWWGCIMVVDDLNFDCRIVLEKVGPLQPGQEMVVPIAFLNPSLVLPRLCEGKAFKLRENKIVGEGSVLRILRADG